MSLMCKLFGHKMKRHEATGISPRLLKMVHRVVYICERQGCDLREQYDTVIGDFNLREGINLWGSGGVCYGCKKRETCPAEPGKAMIQNTSLGLAVLTAGFCYIHCPLHAFEIKDEEKNRLEQWGDTLTD